jgi:hypothetical protein
MRVPSNAALNEFLMTNSNVYPYNNLKPTRNSFFCKWVLLKGRDKGVTVNFPVLANGIPNAVLLDLICSGEGKPLPPELSQIMDDMYWWGKTRILSGMNKSLECWTRPWKMKRI